jgi:hypothetical protein
MEISKNFDFKSAEAKWYAHWLANKYFEDFLRVGRNQISLLQYLSFHFFNIIIYNISA